MIVDGHGLLGRAFQRVGDPATGAYVFARGVADSTCRDPAPYARELACLADALDRAASLGLTFVYFSGAPVYGRFDRPVDEDTPIRPASPYGIHQSIAERIVEDHRARHLVVRLPNVVGPSGNPHQLLPSLLHQATTGAVSVQGHAARDLIDVDDVAGAVGALIASGVADRTVVVASGISTPVRDIVTWLTDELGLDPGIVERPGGEAQRFRIDLLRSLLPGRADFAPGYPREVVVRFARAATTPASA